MKRLLYALSLLVFTLAACSESTIDVNDSSKAIHLSCDAENISGDKLIGKGDIEFDGAGARSKKKSRSGKYSLRLHESNAYGFGYVIENVKKGTVISAEVWKNKDAKSGALVISEYGSNENYESSGHFREIKGDWGKVTTMYVAEEDMDSVNVYVYNLEKDPVYFDDFKLNIYRNARKPKVSKKTDALRIHIPKGAQDSLDFYRRAALEQGVIGKDQKEYVHAFIEINGKKAPVKLRLKGDWTDHLETDKMSYRIKVGDGYAYKGLRTFSIQHPKTRSYAMEWFAHQLFEEEDILTTRYEMIPVIINGENCGVYAMEEHFDKQLLESRKRREGPIMKFDESGMWDVNKHMKETGSYLGAPVIESAEITVFKKGRTKRTPTLFAQFLEAQSCMEKYRSGAPNVEEFMDIESMAKYLALMELTGGKHGLTWHNQRFYFNPITQKLEPIGYDCFMEQNLLIKKKDIIALKDPNDHEYILSRGVLKDKKLLERYAYYLKKFSDPDYLKKMYKKLDKKIQKVEKLLCTEYPGMKISRDHFEFNRKYIAKNLHKIKDASPASNYEGHYGTLPENFIYEDVALKANLEKYNADSSAQMSLRNFHSHGIEIIGYTVKDDGLGFIAMNPVKLKPYGEGTTKIVRFPAKPKRIHYRADNCGEAIFKCNPEEWPEAKAKAPAWKENATILEKNDSYVIRGKMRLNKGLIIPDGKELFIEAGSEITLEAGGFIVSYAPVLARGRVDKPIVIKGTSDQSQGFVCLSKESSQLSYVNFDNLGTMSAGNWRLTGAVTFYNAGVNLDHCTFKNNHCEDGLNTIRCEVEINNCVVENTYSDGYDGDFCTGTVKNSTFTHTGNDCIDFSGSDIQVISCTINNSGDKGVSGGEDSKVTVSNCTINGAQIAVASKDKSEVIVKNINIVKAHTAYSAYQKKPEYGPASLIVESETQNKAKRNQLIEKDSKLIYLGKEFVGTERFDIDAMYAEFEKP